MMVTLRRRLQTYLEWIGSCLSYLCLRWYGLSLALSCWVLWQEGRGIFEKDTYFATISVKINKMEKEIDARPSDAIALALRVNVPIFVTEEILNNASTGKITIENEKEMQLAKLREKMKQAVAVENYEKAAKLRDQIKSIEKNNLKK